MAPRALLIGYDSPGGVTARDAIGSRPSCLPIGPRSGRVECARLCAIGSQL